MEEINILKLIRTDREQQKAIELIENMIKDMFKNKTTLNEQSPFLKNLSDGIIKTITTKKISDNKIEVEEYLNSLLLKIRNLNKLKLSIAIEPNEKIINNLKTWASKNMSYDFIFEFNVDSKILGGTIIVNKNGEYADFSLLKKVNDLFLNHKEEVLKFLLPAIPASSAGRRDKL